MNRVINYLKLFIVMSLCACGTVAMGADNPKRIAVKHFTVVSAPDGTPDNRSTIGVAEDVVFYIVELPSGARTGDSSVQWTASDGAPLNYSGAILPWRAMSRPDQATITAQYKDASASESVKVIQPDAVFFKKLSETPYSGVPIPNGISGAAMQLQLKLLPLNVCFVNIEWRENVNPPNNEPINMGPGDYFDNIYHHDPAELRHKGGRSSVVLKTNILATIDESIDTENPPFNSPGTYTWRIPNDYRTAENPLWCNFTTVNQVVTLTPMSVDSARIQIDKTGANTVSVRRP